MSGPNLANSFIFERVKINGRKLKILLFWNAHIAAFTEAMSSHHLVCRKRRLVTYYFILITDKYPKLHSGQMTWKNRNTATVHIYDLGPAGLGFTGGKETPKSIRQAQGTENREQRTRNREQGKLSRGQILNKQGHTISHTYKKLHT